MSHVSSPSAVSRNQTWITRSEYADRTPSIVIRRSGSEMACAISIRSKGSL